MNGNEPQMCKRRPDDRIVAVVRVEPVEEGLHFQIEIGSGRRFVVNGLAAAVGIGNNLHPSGLVMAPCANGDLVHAAAAGRK